MKPSILLRWSTLLVVVPLLTACGGGHRSQEFVSITKATASPLRVSAPTVGQPSTFVVQWSAESSSNCLNSNLMASQPGRGYSFGSQTECGPKDFTQTCTVSADADDPNSRLVSCNRADPGFQAVPGSLLVEVESFYTSETYPNPVFSDAVSINVTLE